MPWNKCFALFVSNHQLSVSFEIFCSDRKGTQNFHKPFPQVQSNQVLENKLLGFWSIFRPHLAWDDISSGHLKIALAVKKLYIQIDPLCLILILKLGFSTKIFTCKWY